MVRVPVLASRNGRVSFPAKPEFTVTKTHVYVETRKLRPSLILFSWPLPLLLFIITLNIK